MISRLFRRDRVCPAQVRPAQPELCQPQERSQPDATVDSAADPAPRRAGRFWLGAIALWLVLGIGLGGCLDSTTTIQFGQANGGVLSQVLRFDDGVTVFGEETAAVWLKNLGDRARSLGGRVRSPAPEAIAVTIPFANGQDLVQKAARLFETASAIGLEPSQPANDKPGRSPLRLELVQQNFGLVVRNELHYAADLRSLALVAHQGPSRLFQWEFRLVAPWARPIDPTSLAQTTGQNLTTSQTSQTSQTSRTISPEAITPEAITPEAIPGGWRWSLEPGRENDLAVVFWVPSWLGLGSVAIAILVAIGWWSWP